MKELTRRYQFDYQEFNKWTGTWNTHLYLKKSFDSVSDAKIAIEEEKRNLKEQGGQVQNFRVIEMLRTVIEEDV
jgi:hypothetical protein